MIAIVLVVVIVIVMLICVILVTIFSMCVVALGGVVVAVVVVGDDEHDDDHDDDDDDDDFVLVWVARSGSIIRIPSISVVEYEIDRLTQLRARSTGRSATQIDRSAALPADRPLISSLPRACA